mgnify:FL=1
MGTGDSGRYYTSYGSKKIHHGALIHSFDGRYSHDQKSGKIINIKSGGHGQSAMDIMDKNGIKYNIVKKFTNDVRVGNITGLKDKLKKTGSNMAWFPRNWSQKDMVKAAEHVVGLKHNRGIKDGVTMWGVYKGVKVGVKRTNGQIATVFPDAHYQPKGGRKK